MKRKEILEVIMSSVYENDVIVTTTGLITREVYEKYHSERNIYVPGSMGLTSSIGLGFALSCKNLRVVLIDGDASILMNLGSMVTIGHNNPNNLLHIVIDNNSYGSCSEEKSMSNVINLDRLALDVGYNYVKKVDCEVSLKSSILNFKSGPGFVVVETELGGRRDFLRPLNLEELKKDFLQFMENNNKEEDHEI